MLDQKCRSKGAPLAAGDAAEAEAGRGNSTRQIALMICNRAAFLFGGADGYHQRDQVIFARMRGTGGGGLRPCDKAIRAFMRGRVNQRLLKPGIELA